MISIIETNKMTDLSVVSACSLGLACSATSSLRGTGLSGISAVSPLSLAIRPERKRNERPTQAPAAAVAKGQAHQAYAFAAAGAGAEAGVKKQTMQHHTMWAFRGPEPWSDPA